MFVSSLFTLDVSALLSVALLSALERMSLLSLEELSTYSSLEPVICCGALEELAVSLELQALIFKTSISAHNKAAKRFKSIKFTPFLKT